MNRDSSLFINAEGSILASLNEDQQRAALAVAVQRDVKKGEVLLAQGEPGTSMFVVRRGICKVVIYTSSGKEVILDYIGPGQAFGEISLFDEMPRTASVIAVEPSKITEFQRRDVLKLLEQDPDMAIRVVRLLCQRLRKTDALIESDRSYAMSSKLARGLLRLLEDHGMSLGEARHLRFPISQGDLGNFVSVSRENVTARLSGLQDCCSCS